VRGSGKRLQKGFATEQEKRSICAADGRPDQGIRRNITIKTNVNQEKKSGISCSEKSSPFRPRNDPILLPNEEFLRGATTVCGRELEPTYHVVSTNEGGEKKSSEKLYWVEGGSRTYGPE